MSMLNKTTVALILLGFFAFGSSSVILTARGPSNPRLPQYVNFHGSSKNRLPQLDRKTLNTGMIIEEDGDLVNPSEDQSIAGKIVTLPLQDWSTISTSPIIFASKVSTNIFQSVLNL